MATLIWTESAVADLEEIGQFISKDNPPAAEKVGSNIIREVFRGFPPQYVSKLGAAIGSSKKKPLELERRRRIAEWI
jgi:ParE toxin of type II toxin-antitoxin system, parDE